MGEYKQLTLLERRHISWFLENEYSFREIAEELGVNPSTITHEVHRNSVDDTYDPDIAHALYEQRKAIPRKAKIITDEIGDFIKSELIKGNVPKNIALVIQEKFNKKISYQTIYNFKKSHF